MEKLVPVVGVLYAHHITQKKVALHRMVSVTERTLMVSSPLRGRSTGAQPVPPTSFRAPRWRLATEAENKKAAEAEALDAARPKRRFACGL